MRKSFDETGSRLDEKYGERFWQSQVQRMLKQSQNYSMLYNTNKKIRDKEKIELRSENEKLHKTTKEMESRMKVLKDEIKSYKEQLVSGADQSHFKKGIVKPVKKVKDATVKEEVKSRVIDYTPQVDPKLQLNILEVNKSNIVSVLFLSYVQLY
jgi:hypothetical protein